MSDTVKAFGSGSFEAVDYQVMRHAYASQNELGRLCDECIYQTDLKARLLAEGFRSVATEVPVKVTHRDFSRTYYLDLVADDALHELKASAGLTGEHVAQLLNYMFLLGIPRAKLLNFRTPKVQGKIVATSLTTPARSRFSTSASHWLDLSEACKSLRSRCCELLQDWGAFLELGLYQEALVHFLGGIHNLERRVTLSRSETALGTQRMLVHAPDIAFRVTAVTDSRILELHLSRLLAATQLKAIQWINLNHAQIEFRTVTLRS